MKFAFFQVFALSLLTLSTASPVGAGPLEPRQDDLSKSSDYFSKASNSYSTSVYGRANGLTNYLIYPKSNTPQKKIDAFTVKLQSEVGKAHVETINDAKGRVLVWCASLTSTQATAVKSSDIVDGINADSAMRTQPGSSDLTKRKVVTEKSTLKEVSMFSNPPGEVLSEYNYDKKGGKGSTVYVIDEGFNLKHREFTQTSGTKRWIFADTSGQNDPKSDGHGSCAASKAVGKTVGIARSANLVAVKIENSQTSFLKAWAKIILDVKQNLLEGKAVVSISILRWADDNPRFLAALYTLVADLIDMDVVVVSSTGNFGRQYPVTMFPSKFADRLPIIVVGGVEQDGSAYSLSQTGPLVTTTAPAVNVKCAVRTGSSYQTADGTSFAAPAVAGLAAYFLSLDSLKPRLQIPGSVARNVKNLIQEHHYARVEGGPQVAWNAFTILHD